MEPDDVKSRWEIVLPPREEIADSLVHASGSTYRHNLQRLRLLNGLLYPALLVIVCGILFLALCIYLIPQFEQLFEEFQLTLPGPTILLFAISRFVRNWGVLLLVLFALAMLVIGIRIWISRHPGNHPRQNRWFRSRRSVEANWAWHVSLLIDAGLPQQDAVAVAGTVGKPSPLIALALTLGHAADQSGLLREAAQIHWDREGNQVYWWLSWVTPATVCLIGVLQGLVVLALFMPLVELISGLT